MPAHWNRSSVIRPASPRTSSRHISTRWPFARKASRPRSSTSPRARCLRARRLYLPRRSGHAVVFQRRLQQRHVNNNPNFPSIADRRRRTADWRTAFPASAANRLLRRTVHRQQNSPPRSKEPWPAARMTPPSSTASTPTSATHLYCRTATSTSPMPSSTCQPTPPRRHVAIFTQLGNLLSEQHIGPIGYPGLPFTIRAGLKIRIGGQ